MLSHREREYVSDKEEFGVKYGLPYVRVLRQRIKKKAEQAIKDLTLIAQHDEDFEEIEKKTRQWAMYKNLKGEGSGVFDKKELAAHFLNPPKHGNSAISIIRLGDIEELINAAIVAYHIRGDIVERLITYGNFRLRYPRIGLRRKGQFCRK